MPASYPTSIKSFLTYYDQPPDPTKVDPATGIDLTIDRAQVTNEIHDEVISIEQIVGVTGQTRYTTIPGTKTLKDEIKALYTGKSWGRVDPSNNAIYPAPPPTHTHPHAQLTGRLADDHPQYMRVDGHRGFSAPVSAPNAVKGNELATLEQATNNGWINSAGVDFVIWTTVAGKSAYRMVGAYPTGGITTQRYRWTGGYAAGYTDSNGLLRVDWSAANYTGILTVAYMKMPFPGRSAYGYTYQYEEDQLTLYEVDANGMWIQFIEDVIVDRQSWVAMTWMVIGV